MSNQDIEADADQEVSNYRQKLVILDSELDSENIKSLKYLCFDAIPVSKLEKITQGTDLFSLLEQTGKLGNGNYFFLAECLSKICRIDLSEKLLNHDVLKTTIDNSGSRIPSHRSLWFDVGEDLDSEEVCKCLYYYGEIPKSKRGGIKSGMDFLTYLEKMKKIGPDNMSYLKEVLRTIERNDLVEMIQKYQDQSSTRVPFRPTYQPPPPSSAGRQFDEEVNSWKAKEKEKGLSADDQESQKVREKEKMLSMSGEDNVSRDQQSLDPQSSIDIPMPMQIQLAYQISAEPKNIPDLGKLLGLSSDELDSISSNNSTRPDMKVLEMMRKWSGHQSEGEDKVKELLEALDRSGYEQLSEGLRTQLFRQNEGSTVDPAETRVPEDTLQELPVNRAHNFRFTVPSHSDDHENIYIKSGEARCMNPGEDSINLRQRNAEIADVRPPGPPPPLLEMYRMDRFPRGMCVIFNNETFTCDVRNPDAKKMNNRVGSSIDRDALKCTFEGLGFDVFVHDNLPAVEMVQTLTEYSLKDHSAYDCFVCVLLSHGTRDYIYGSNGIAVPIRTLADPLKNLSCPGLCGKPKLFFIQACQGQDKQHGRDIERDAIPGSDLDEDAPSNGEVIPNEQDFLIGMATIPGFVSYRSKTSGSWYIIKLCDALQKYAEHWDILHILTYVNSEVGKANADIDGIRYKQSPGPLYTLRKRLLFQPIAH